MSHKKVCQKPVNHNIHDEINPEEETKPVVSDLDLIETEEQLENQELLTTISDGSSIEKPILRDAKVRPKRISRLIAEKKLLEFTKSTNGEASNDEGSDYDCNQNESDSGKSDEETDGVIEKDKIPTKGEQLDKHFIQRAQAKEMDKSKKISSFPVQRVLQPR